LGQSALSLRNSFACRSLSSGIGAVEVTFGIFVSGFKTVGHWFQKQYPPIPEQTASSLPVLELLDWEYVG
jgi:hypothetical protein